MKKFIVLTTGRSGSTALMDSLSVHADIGLPKRLYPCDDDELFHPNRLKKTAAFFRERGHKVSSEKELGDAFFRECQRFSYAGFKSMPNRHHDLTLFTAQPDVRVICIRRGDLYSTAASFAAAARFGTWRREGEPQSNRFAFAPENEEFVRSNLGFLSRSWQTLDEVAGAIQLRFEEMCRPDFVDEALDEFFGRRVTLLNPRPPVSGETYVTNWSEFRQFVRSAWLEVGGDESLLEG